MSFDVDVVRRLGEREVGAAFRVGGGLTVLFGPSGSGKTSVLNMIAGLLRPDRGRVIVDERTLFDQAQGIDVPAERRRIGYIFQDARLFPHRRVRQNLLYGHRLAAPGHRWLAFDEAVDLLGVRHLLGRWPATLSGGEAQRVAIGRALLSGASALLMDEPLSSIDAARRDEIMILIEKIRDTIRVPILYVTHDRAEADRLGSRIVRMTEGNGSWRAIDALDRSYSEETLPLDRIDQPSAQL